MALLSLAVAVLGLTAGSLALRLEGARQPKAAFMAMRRGRDQEPTCVPPQPYRQQLVNVMDLQYLTELTVGGQKITGILDTTSFDLVVFSSRCDTCGASAVYNEERSPTFVPGALNKTHYYQTGCCSTMRANDTAQLGCYSTHHQAMWLADWCHLPHLDGGFHSIVGVGPPSQPEQIALEALKEVETKEEAIRGRGGVISPEDDARARASVQAQLVDAICSKSLLENLGMRAFSICLGKKASSPAWMVWNDITREGAPATMRLPVSGTITWGVTLQRMSLEFTPSTDTDVSRVSEMTVGCERGCGAVVDTGTSLLAVPSDMKIAIGDMLDQHVTAAGCSDLSNYPSLVLTVAGHKLRLPPSSYIGKVSGQASQQNEKFLQMNRRTWTWGEDDCQLLLLDLGNEETQFGPMVILGMPLFRQYYTTFDLGPADGERSIFVTPADESCGPDQSASVKYARDHEAVTPRQVSLGHVRAPEWLKNRTGVDI